MNLRKIKDLWPNVTFFCEPPLNKQVPVGTKIRPSDLFGDETDDFGDGKDKRSQESPKLVFIQFPIILDHLERIL